MMPTDVIRVEMDEARPHRQAVYLLVHFDQAELVQGIAGATLSFEGISGVQHAFRILM